MSVSSERFVVVAKMRLSDRRQAEAGLPRPFKMGDVPVSGLLSTEGMRLP